MCSKIELTSVVGPEAQVASLFPLISVPPAGCWENTTSFCHWNMEHQLEPAAESSMMDIYAYLFIFKFV